MSGFGHIDGNSQDLWNTDNVDKFCGMKLPQNKIATWKLFYHSKRVWLSSKVFCISLLISYQAKNSFTKYSEILGGHKFLFIITQCNVVKLRKNNLRSQFVWDMTRPSGKSDPDISKQRSIVIYKGNSISKLQIQVATYVFELSAGNCHR